MRDYERLFTLTDQEALRRPFALFEAGRREAPVEYSDRGGHWVVSSYELAARVLQDATTFSTSLIWGPRSDEVLQAVVRIASRSEDARAIEGYGSTPRRVLLYADPPAHTHQRELVSRALTPAYLRTLAPRIEQLAREAVGRIGEGEYQELGRSFALAYTTSVIAAALGLPPTDVPCLMEWSHDFNRSVGSRELSPEQIERAAETQLAFDLYVNAQIEDRLAGPRDDLVTLVAEANRTSETPLARDELFQIFRLVLVGGDVTPARHIVNMVLHLAGHPGAWAELKGNPQLVPGFVEETLRAEPPTNGSFRLVTRETELGGVKMERGDVLFLATTSANRDPAVFACPDELILDRPNGRRHLSFGQGAHLCVGRRLARMEMRILLEALLQRFDAVRLRPGDQPAYRRSVLFHEPDELYVAFTTAGAREPSLHPGGGPAGPRVQ